VFLCFQSQSYRRQSGVQELEYGQLGMLASVEMNRKRHTRPAKLHKSRRDLSLAILNQNTSTNTKISIPPSRVQSSSIWCNAQLNIASRSLLVRDRLQSSSQSIDVSTNHGDAVSTPVCRTNSKSDEGGAVSRGVVFPSCLELVVPCLTFR